MKSEMIQKLQNQFDALSQSIPEEGIEFWFARDLCPQTPTFAIFAVRSWGLDGYTYF